MIQQPEITNSKSTLKIIMTLLQKMIQIDAFQKHMICIVQPLVKFCREVHQNYHMALPMHKDLFGKIQLVFNPEVDHL